MAEKLQNSCYELDITKRAVPLNTAVFNERLPSLEEMGVELGMLH